MSDARGAQTPSVAATRILCTSAAFAELSAEVLRAGTTLRFRARGWSMSPLVRDGDVVWVQPVEPGSLRVGDVVLCALGDSPGGRVVVHRVVRRLEGPYGLRVTVQGDRVAQPDGSIPALRVYGRVAAIQRDGARIDMDWPVMRWLGRLAVVHSRLASGRRFGVGRRVIKRLPVLSRYLA